jgi:hypothetical protein
MGQLDLPLNVEKRSFLIIVTGQDVLHRKYHIIKVVSFDIIKRADS